MKIIILFTTIFVNLSAWAGGSGNTSGGSTLMPGGVLDASKEFEYIAIDRNLGPQHLPDLAEKWGQDIYVNPENPSRDYIAEAAKELMKMTNGYKMAGASDYYVRHIALDGAETVYQTGNIAKSGKVEVQQFVESLDEMQKYPKSFRDSYMKSFASQQNLWVPVAPQGKVMITAEDLAKAARAMTTEELSDAARNVMKYQP